MIPLPPDPAIAQTVALLTHYGFDLKGYSAIELLSQWLNHYQIIWVRWAVVEALYQGRYKAVSVEQILNFWFRRGNPLFHFNHDFETIICHKLPRDLAAIDQDVTLETENFLDTQNDIIRENIDIINHDSNFNQYYSPLSPSWSFHTHLSPLETEIELEREQFDSFSQQNDLHFIEDPWLDDTDYNNEYLADFEHYESDIEHSDLTGININTQEYQESDQDLVIWQDNSLDLEQDLDLEAEKAIISDLLEFNPEITSSESEVISGITNNPDVEDNLQAELETINHSDLELLEISDIKDNIKENNINYDTFNSPIHDFKPSEDFSSLYLKLKSVIEHNQEITVR